MTETKIKQTNTSAFKRHWQSLKAGLERFGRALIIPISILPIMAIIGAIGYIMISAGTKTGAIHNATFKAFANGIKLLGMSPIYNLDILFAIGLSAGLAKTEKVSAALSGIAALISFYFAANVLLSYTNLKDSLPKAEVGKLETIQRFGKYSNGFNLNALGGILSGYVGYKVHQYTYKLQFPKAIAFFGGPKFSPVATFIIGFLIGLPLTWIWVYVYKAMAAIGRGIRDLGAGGSFLYGFTNRLLLPFGLHNVPNAILRYTPAGGTWTYTPVGGKPETFEGFYNILLAKLQHGIKITPADSLISVGTYPTNIFALPGAAVGMFLAVPKARRKLAAPIIFGAVSSSILSGVTEPIEFTFIFTAPLLWVTHAFLTGFTYMFMYLSGTAAISGTGEGIITWFIYNAPAYELVPRVWMLWVLGPLFFIEYLVVFYFMITKLNLNTPGRDAEEFKLYTKQDFRNKLKNQSLEDSSSDNQTTINNDYNIEQLLANPILEGEKAEDIKKAVNLITAYGGFSNMKEIGACISRLRIAVVDKNLVNKDLIKQNGSLGIVDSGEQVQSVFGAKAMVYARIMNLIKTIE
ncbi:PTS sugar transporter subunit IIC [Mycoplasma sp. NEAQ87857]|uniref:PTS transporter subunit EIIC n=1 Tax=Mycoplasma sp. NEAQ87857 TaxID=2683967 RepID=UPI001317F57F|nr:PTS transporter subunit EIIC [Mycoplasma sp. NEAQ87857]QGZ97482.1 PTS sugar transporter subunit IIC [Mycoplasma sp. NEAQ87857]